MNCCFKRCFFHNFRQNLQANSLVAIGEAEAVILLNVTLLLRSDTFRPLSYDVINQVRVVVVCGRTVGGHQRKIHPKK